MGVEVRYNAPVNRAALNGSAPKFVALHGEFDAMYLAYGSYSSDLFEVARDANGRIDIDPVTFQTHLDGVFAGGGLRHGKEFRSAIQSISDGRRAAISIDRYLQRVSLTASRINEGGYENAAVHKFGGHFARAGCAHGRPSGGLHARRGRLRSAEMHSMRVHGVRKELRISERV
ncbi:MAG: hypothetical protein V9G11_06870 [Bifidobacterium adolescentis]